MALPTVCFKQLLPAKGCFFFRGAGSKVVIFCCAVSAGTKQPYQCNNDYNFPLNLF